MKEEFKKFVKEHPQLLKYVKDNSMTWQKFYEMYDMYGNSDAVWEPYLKKEVVAATATAGVLDWLKNINLDSVQEGINSVQRVLGMFKDMGGKTSETKEEYKPRPMYKHFED